MRGFSEPWDSPAGRVMSSLLSFPLTLVHLVHVSSASTPANAVRVLVAGTVAHTAGGENQQYAEPLQLS
jgi:hypothetical protein